MLEYLEFGPRPPLSRFVECLWTLSEPGGGPVPRAPEPILPDGRVEIVLNCAAAFRRDHANGPRERQPLRMCVGQMQRPLLIAPTGCIDLVGIRFRPAGAGAFLHMPMSELAGRTVALAEIAPRLDRGLAQALDVTPSRRVAAVEAVLSGWPQSREQRLGDGPSRWDPATGAAVRLLVQSGGRAPLDALAAAARIGPRQLERRFLHAVGLHPKTLARILRFQRVFHAVAKGTETPTAARATAPQPDRVAQLAAADRIRHDCSRRPHWAAVAVDCGYYDQAHLIRDFREFAGQTPALLLQTEAELTRVFTRAHRHANAR